MTPDGAVIAHTAIPGFEHLFKPDCTILGMILVCDPEGEVSNTKHRNRSQRKLPRRVPRPRQLRRRQVQKVTARKRQ
jgi:hypothetical protein